MNGFSLGVISDSDHEKIKRGEYNYIALSNGTEYRIELSNTRSTDAMAEVFLEGDLIGTWIIPAHDRIVVERPVDTARKFTFFRETDTRATSAGVIPGADSNGLIKAVFYPKKQYVSVAPFRVAESYLQTGATRTGTTLASPSRSTMASSPSQSMGSLASPSSPRSMGSFASPSSPRLMASSPSRSQLPYRSGATVLGESSDQSFRTTRRFSDNEIDWSNKTTISIRLVVQSKPVTITPSYTAIGRRTSSPPRIDSYHDLDTYPDPYPYRIDSRPAPYRPDVYY